MLLENFIYKFDKSDGFEDVPDDIFEEHRLLPAAETADLRGYLSSLTEKLLQRPDVKVETVRYLISDSHQKNACIYPNLDPPLIIVNKGLLSGTRTVGQTKYVLYHEIAHKHLQTATGLNMRGRVDENAADNRAVIWMAEEGENWREAQDFHRNGSDWNFKEPGEVLNYIASPHSGGPERQKYIEMSIGAWINTANFEWPPEPSPVSLPDWALERSEDRSQKHISFYEALNAYAREKNFSRSERIAAVATLSPSEAIRNHQRFIELCRMLRKEAQSVELTPDTWPLTTEAHRQYFEKAGLLLDKFGSYLGRQSDTDNYDAGYAKRERQVLALYSSASGHVVHPDYLENRLGQSKQPFNGLSLCLPFGQFAKIDTAIGEFINSPTEGAAVRSAATLNEVVLIARQIEQYASLVDNLLVRFASFSASNKDEIYPWDRFIDWSKNDNSLLIAQALWHIGVSGDERLWNVVPLEQLETMSSSSQVTAPFAVPGYAPAQQTHSSPIGLSFTEARGWLYPFTVEDGRISHDEYGQEISRNMYDNYKALHKFIEQQKTRPALERIPPDQIPARLTEYQSNIILEADRILLADAPNEESIEKLKEIEFSIVEDLNELGRLGLLSSQFMGDFLFSEIDTSKLPLGAKRYDWEENEFIRAYFEFSWDVGRHRMYGPLTTFIIDDPHDLLSRKVKFTALSHLGMHTHLGPGSAHDERPDFAFWRNALDYEEPTLRELPALADDILLFEGVMEAYGGLWAGETNDAILREKPSIGGPEMAALLPKLQTVQYNQSNVEQELLDTIRSLIGNYREGDLYTATQANIYDLIGLYLFYEQQGLLENSLCREDLGNAILEGIRDTGEASEKLRLCERLIFTQPEGDKGQRRSSVRYVALKSKAIEIWSAAQFEILGPDDNSQEYFEKVTPLIADIVEHNAPQTVHQSLAALTDQIVSQRRVSEYCWTSIEQNTRSQKNVDKGHFGIATGEMLINYFSSDNMRRENFIEFLLHPMSRTRAQDLAATMQADGDAFWHDNYRKYKVGDLPVGTTHYAIMLEDFHEFFWEQKIELRAIMLDPVLISAREIAAMKGRRGTGPFDMDELETPAIDPYVRATDQAIERLLPFKENQSHSDRTDTELTRDFVRSFIGVSHVSEKGLILAALMASSMASEVAGESLELGDRLVLLADMLGPAYRKVLQAGHGLQEIPRKYRDSFGVTKTMATKKERWWLYRRFDETVPAELRKGVRLGKIIGSASLFVSADAFMPDGKVQVVSMLDDDAIRKSRFGFDKLERAAHDLASHRPELKDALTVFAEMIRQASELVEIETNLHEGARQNDIAQVRYGGLEVITGRRMTQLNPMPWTTYSDEARFMDKADGVHFMDLPQKSAAEIAGKRQIAITHLTVIFLHLLDGGEFDTDFHAGQSCVKDNKIGRYDYGGLTLQKPSESEKEVFAQALSTILKQGLGSSNSAEALFGEIRRVQNETGKRPDHLMKVQKALIAGNDFMEFLHDQKTLPNDLRNIMAAIVADGHIDPTISRALPIGSVALTSAASVLLAKATTMSRDGIKIKRSNIVTVPTARYVPYSSDDRAPLRPAADNSDHDQLGRNTTTSQRKSNRVSAPALTGC